MKTYTFKIKTKTNVDDTVIDATIIAIHCPIEVFYDSVKATKEFEKLCADIYISDYYQNITSPAGDDDNPVIVEKVIYITDETYFGSVENIMKSNSLKEFYLLEDLEEKKNENI